MAEKKLLVLASPSGGGKSTVARHLQKKYPDLLFSISATTRKKRPHETYGVEYYFLSKEDFEKRIKEGDLVEYEQMFGNYYGTLKSEIDKALISGDPMLFDIDVKGALSLRRVYPEQTLLVFISPPSLKELERRLKQRSTETDEEIENRLARAKMEMDESPAFDYVVINEDLERTFREMDEIVEKEMGIKPSN